VRRLTRRQALTGAAGIAALGSAGIYELVDQLGTAPPRAAAASLPPEQHLLEGQRVVRDNGVEVLVPPLHDELVTVQTRARTAADVRAAQAELEQALAELEQEFPPTPAGLGVTVGWGLPYFDRLVPGQAKRHLPHDRRAEKPALLPAIRFPSDPPETRLERNDAVFLLRSDSLAHLQQASDRLFKQTALFDLTSIRRGFAGGGFDGGKSLPKRMATAAGVPGAELIPDTSELFLGFTSTQKAGIGPGKIANFETLGYVDVRDSGYFRGGTHMHVSHILEDLEAWYLNFDFRERVDTAFRPNLRVKPDVQTVPQGPPDTQTIAQVRRDYRSTGRIGHSGSIQPTSRLQQHAIGPDGTVYPKGTAIPQRADFNTLDNPFAWSAHPERDGMAEGAASGWTASCPARACRSSRAPAGRASTRSSARRTGRTSSCRRGSTGRSRSPS
jgi:hypothetical protein